MASFPEPYVVSYRQRIVVDDGMSTVESWADEVSLRVYGWGPPSSDDVVRAEQTGVKHELDVYCKASPTKHRDKLVINGVEWDVQGEPDDYNFGPFGFKPGVRVKLTRAEG